MVNFNAEKRLYLSIARQLGGKLQEIVQFLLCPFRFVPETMAGVQLIAATGAHDRRQTVLRRDLRDWER